MIPPIQQELLRQLGQLCDLSPDIRLGQLMAHLGYLVEDRTERTLGDVEDEDLLAIFEHHRGELLRRQEHVA